MGSDSAVQSAESTPAIRRRRARRRIIADAALDLFRERGYEATTMEAIAARADISPRTLFNYVGSKEEAIFPIGSDDIVESVRAAPIASEANVGVLGVALLMAWSTRAGGFDSEREWERFRLIEEIPQLRAENAYRVELIADAVALVVAQRREIDEVDARLASRVFAACLATALTRWVHEPFTDFGPLFLDTVGRLMRLREVFV